MRIAIFTNNYLPNPYGVTQSVESFRKQFEKQGHVVYIFAPRWKGYRDENPRVFRYPSICTNIKFKFPLPIPYSFKINNFLSKSDFDIIHSQHPNLLGAAAAKWAKKKNIPLVFTWHTLYDKYAHFAAVVPEKLAAWWSIRNAKNYANKADCVVTPTESIIPIIQNWSVTNKNIKAIPSGVEEEAYKQADRKIIRDKFGVKDGEILLLLVSRLTAEKNVEFLFRSVIRVLNKHSRAKFLVAGDGYLVPQLKSLAKENNLEDKIIFAGIVDKSEIKNYYAAGDIFVYASKSETQGMIVGEAMYMGLPVVAVSATGIQDLVRDKISGYLVKEDEKEFSEAVEKLIKSESLRQAFSNEAKKMAREKLTDSVCAFKMLNLYQETIENFKKKFKSR